MAMPTAKGITTKGLKYSLNNESLEFGVREGTLNKTSAKSISISFKSGNLLLFIGK
jgi:thiamine pyrophosphokinase